jgi:hypothetical protein
MCDGAHAGLGAHRFDQIAEFLRQSRQNPERPM